MKAIIYRINNSETCYIGQTIKTLEQRWSRHKGDYERFINGKGHWKSSFIMFMNDEEPTIEILEEGEFSFASHIKWVETSYIMANDCCNRNQQFGNKIASRKDFYQKYKVKHNEKFTCECGGKYTRQNKPQHLKSQKHRVYDYSLIGCQ
jgi:hypothetical protein